MISGKQFLGLSAVGAALLLLLKPKPALAAPPGSPPTPPPAPGATPTLRLVPTPTAAPRLTQESNYAMPAASSPGTGSAFANSIQNLTDTARENVILSAFADPNNIPPALRNYVPVTTSIPGHTGTFFVSPDYLGIGTNEDWIRVPMFPGTAQRILDSRGDVLPTYHMVDLIHQAAPQKIGFTAHTPTTPGVNETTAMYRTSNQDAQSRSTMPLGTLTAGEKKDIVIGKLVASNPTKVTIYGAWYADGTRIQPYQAPHAKTYVDYSHGVRAVKASMNVDGQSMFISDVLQNPTLAPLLSAEGVLTAAGTRYPI